MRRKNRAANGKVQLHDTLLAYLLPTSLPAIRPNVIISVIAFPPRRFLPWITPVNSPAAYKPGIGSPFHLTLLFFVDNNPTHCMVNRRNGFLNVVWTFFKRH